MIEKNLIEGDWYHGDLFDTDFNTRKMDVEDYSRDRNAMGPGIYFSRDRSQASGYAEKSGFIYTATMDLNLKRVMTVKTKPDATKVRKFIMACPDKESLYNYDNNPVKAVEVAIRLNMESKNLHDAVMGVYNDLYQKDSRGFAKSMVDIGYDAYLHRLPEIDHLIVWNPSVIQIKDKVKRTNESIYKMKNISTLEDFLNEKNQVEIGRDRTFS